MTSVPRRAYLRRTCAVLISALTVLAISGAFLGVLLLAPGAGHVHAANARQPPTVVFLLFDEFPVIDLENDEGKIDSRRFPNFARLAQSSIWFRNTTTLSANTTFAVPAILTGNPPSFDALPTAHNYPKNLFTLLGPSYRMVVYEPETKLCPERICEPPPPGAATHEGGPLPKLDRHTFWRRRIRHFDRWLGAVRPDGGRPTLYFMHTLFPHGPWVFLPDGRLRARSYTRTPGRIGDRWYNAQLAIQAWQRHLLQTGFTDRLLGQVLARLHRTGLWNKALIVVTADHGISFRSGDLRRRPSSTNLAELAFTPLFVKLPGLQQGRVVDRHVVTVDILPTIADALGITIPWKTEGSSALRGGNGSPIVTVNAFSAPYSVELAQRQSSRDRQLGLFGSGTWGAQFAGTGDYRALVGEPVRALEVGAHADGDATIDRIGSALLRSFPRHSPLIPSPLVGDLAAVEPSTQLALALNGQIAAVTEAYRDPRGAIKFSALAGESAFATGRNRVQMFAVSGPASRPVLHELRLFLSR